MLIVAGPLPLAGAGTSHAGPVAVHATGAGVVNSSVDDAASAATVPANSCISIADGESRVVTGGGSNARAASMRPQPRYGFHGFPSQPGNPGWSAFSSRCQRTSAGVS